MNGKQLCVQFSIEIKNKNIKAENEIRSPICPFAGGKRKIEETGNEVRISNFVFIGQSVKPLSLSLPPSNTHTRTRARKRSNSYFFSQ